MQRAFSMYLLAQVLVNSSCSLLASAHSADYGCSTGYGITACEHSGNRTATGAGAICGTSTCPDSTWSTPFYPQRQCLSCGARSPTKCAQGRYLSATPSPSREEAPTRSLPLTMHGRPACTATTFHRSQTNPVARDDHHRLGPTGNTKRFENGGQMNLDRPFRQAEQSGDLPVGFA